MPQLLVNYQLNATQVSNPDGTLAAQVSGCTEAHGPGNTILGESPKSLTMGATGFIRGTMGNQAIDTKQFCIRIAFKANGPVTGRQNLAESTQLPFAMFLEKTGRNTAEFQLMVSVAPTAHGWSGTSTQYITTLSQNVWYVADLVYDLDTLAVFINGNIVSVHAYPKGAIAITTNKKDFFLGTWVNGISHRLNGSIAAFQWYNGIPEELEKQLDERRSHAEWFISYKYMALAATINLGEKTAKYYYDSLSNATIQDFTNGLVIYSSSIGSAYEMHGLIWSYYKAFTRKSELGYLVSDEINAGVAGARKSLFQKGGIYWSGGTGARAVTGRMYIDYEGHAEYKWIGLPNGEMQAISNGRQQSFQCAMLYYKNGAARAFEVHGSILNKYIASGGPTKWGYPVSDETDVKNGASVIGKLSDFETCTIYWSSSTGAFEVHGDILRKYKDLKGPLGELGFPTSDEADTPGAGGSRNNSFQKGCIVWFGSFDSIHVSQPFKIFLGRINSKENEGFTMGQNDLYVYTSISSNGHTVFSKRFPNTGDYGGHNIVDINSEFNHLITPNSAGLKIGVRFEIWDDDGPTANDHLGTYNFELNIANGWGMRINGGILNSGGFSKINSITWSVRPQVNVALLTEPQKWWGDNNEGTPTLTKTQYASAFRDVDSETEWWDIGDHLHNLFYELVVKGIASGGNCFGMSTEGIYSRKNRSIFSLPLNRFNSFSTFKNEVNIKQAYQVGADPIWWFLGQFVTGNTHSPVSVFQESRAAFNRGENPVVCIAQNYDFSGAPHCILPVAWNSSSKPWRITILDPNIPNATKELLVDPDKNEFSYTGTSSYKGGQWSGGRFHYMPYSILCSVPRTPLWEAILLLLTGVVILVGADSGTQSITDGNGVDLDAFGADATRRLQNGQRIDGKFLSYKGTDATVIKTPVIKKVPIDIGIKPVKIPGKGSIAGEMLISMQPPASFRPITHVIDRPSLISIGHLLTNRTVAANIGNITSARVPATALDRNLYKMASDEAFLKSIDQAQASYLKELAATGQKNAQIIHEVAGMKKGNLDYTMKNPLSRYQIISAINQGEVNKVTTTQPGTDAMQVDMESSAGKTMQMSVDNNLGIGDDKLRITIDKIPLAAKQKTEFNLHQGMGGIDIVGGAEKVNAEITIETTINGRAVKKQYSAPIEGGIRIHPSTVLSGNDLLIGKIDRVFGQVRESTLIKSK